VEVPGEISRTRHQDHRLARQIDADRTTASWDFSSSPAATVLWKSDLVRQGAAVVDGAEASRHGQALSWGRVVARVRDLTAERTR
jgi:hypothetical protein